MREEILHEFTEELMTRTEPIPQDLIRKYRDRGLSESEMAPVLMARSALRGPDVPESAKERSEKRVNELLEQAAARPTDTHEPQTGFWGSVRKLFRMDR